MEDEPFDADAGEALVQVVPQVEATMLSVWRRVIEEGGGPELTLAEAATLLGASVEGVQRRIQAGQLRAFRDSRGRIRVSASVVYTPDDALDSLVVAPPADPQVFERLWHELKAMRRDLDQTEAEKRRLQGELEAAENALEYTKAEVATLWRVMTTRSQEMARKESDARPVGILEFAQERSRIQGKITDVRSIARRRRWPWLQAG